MRSSPLTWPRCPASTPQGRCVGKKRDGTEWRRVLRPALTRPHRDREGLSRAAHPLPAIGIVDMLKRTVTLLGGERRRPSKLRLRSMPGKAWPFSRLFVHHRRGGTTARDAHLADNETERRVSNLRQQRLAPHTMTIRHVTAVISADACPRRRESADRRVSAGARLPVRVDRVRTISSWQPHRDA